MYRDAWFRDTWLSGTSTARSGREGVGVFSHLLGVFAIGPGVRKADGDG
jgi:hypothetical protein